MLGLGESLRNDRRFGRRRSSRRRGNPVRCEGQKGLQRGRFPHPREAGAPRTSHTRPSSRQLKAYIGRRGCVVKSQTSPPGPGGTARPHGAESAIDSEGEVGVGAIQPSNLSAAPTAACDAYSYLAAGARVRGNDLLLAWRAVRPVPGEPRRPADPLLREQEVTGCDPLALYGGRARGLVRRAHFRLRCRAACDRRRHPTPAKGARAIPHASSPASRSDSAATGARSRPVEWRSSPDACGGSSRYSGRAYPGVVIRG